MNSGNLEKLESEFTFSNFLKNKIKARRESTLPNNQDSQNNKIFSIN